MSGQQTNFISIPRASLRDVDLPFLKLSMDLKPPERGQAVEVLIGQDVYPVTVCYTRSADDGAQWVRLLDDCEVGKAMEKSFLHYRSELKDERRIDSRLRVNFRVRSPQLPNRRGTTYDISERGLRLVTEDSVPRGTRLVMEIEEPTAPRGRTVRVVGKCVWSCRRVNSLHHAGIRLE